MATEPRTEIADYEMDWRGPHGSPPPGPLTYEEFLEWADEDTRAEWYDGEVIMTSPASSHHQIIVGFLYRVLHLFIAVHQLGLVLPAPFQMKLRRAGPEPDLIFVSNAQLGRLKPTLLDGPADLVVEVVSSESVERDRKKKFSLYQEAGIPEYWLIDSRTDQAQFFQLNAAGVYQEARPDAEGIYHSSVLPGFFLRIDWLWQAHPPLAEDVLLEIGGEAYARRLIDQLRQRGLLKGT